MDNVFILTEAECKSLEDCINTINNIPQQLATSTNTFNFVVNNEEVEYWSNNTAVGQATVTNIKKSISEINDSLIPNLNKLIRICNQLISESRRYNNNNKNL